jgi:D-alanyl-D-alanine carboxypeptidase
VGVWRRGEHPYVRAFGVRNLATRRPMSPDLHMRIGSETKTFTITALLQLVDQKKVSLDAPNSRYLRGVPDGKRITLRELAEMRSGLFSYTADPGWVRAFLSDPKQQWRPWQLLRYGFRHPLLFKPGSAFNYSNTNTILLGLAAGAMISTLRDLHAWS